MSAIGNPCHNAQAESFMKTLYPAGYETFADVAERLPRCIEDVHAKRLHSAFGYRSLAESGQHAGRPHEAPTSGEPPDSSPFRP
ncbi:MAG: hypothetical protein QHC90_08285 [Shinella sp.]|nr:hypothetical protein [Shinella sp.]